MAYNEDYLRAVGNHVRASREAAGLTRRQLADKSGLSERFLAQLELGEGNISLMRFGSVADALGVTPAMVLSAVEHAMSPKPIALLGIRGAGKSTVGAALATKLERRFIEVDREIEIAAGLPLAEIFQMHGEAMYRQLERQVLNRLLARDDSTVLATGGSIVQDDGNYSLLRSRCRTVWLKATAEDHWKRVIAQGDGRPMSKNPKAFEQLRNIIDERAPKYELADITVDTTKKNANRVVAAIIAGL